MQDSYKYIGLREALVDSLKTKGIQDQAVLNVIRKLPRHFFMESAFWDYAYQDRPFSIGFGQTISQPYTVARQTELLKVEAGHKVLEIGTGSGYQAAILAALRAQVYSIEYHEALSRRAASVMEALGVKVHLFVGDGSLGLDEQAPFDRILVTAGAVSTPRPLINQLKVGGILVIPVGTAEQQTMLRITRVAENQYRQEPFGEFVFVPLVGSYRDLP